MRSSRQLGILVISLLIAALWYSPASSGTPKKNLIFHEQEITSLIQVLQSPKSSLTDKINAARALGKMGPSAREAVPALIQALKDKDYDVRYEAAQALGKIGPAAVPALIQAFKDEKFDGRYYAAIALGNIGPAAVPALIQTLKDENPDVRSYAAIALAGIGPEAKDAVPALIQALKDENPDVRSNAAEALGQIGPAAKEAVPVLKSALRDVIRYVRFKAAYALAELDPSAKEVTPVLVEALQDEYRPHLAASALKRLGMSSRLIWYYRYKFYIWGTVAVMVFLGIPLGMYVYFGRHKRQLEAQVKQQREIISNLGDEALDVDKRLLAREEKAKLDFARNLVSAFTLETLTIRDHTFFAPCTWEIQPRINVLLGKNGYGKTHLLRSLVGLLQNDPKTYEVFSPKNAKALFTLSLRRDGAPVTIEASREILRNIIGKVPLLAIPDSRFINKSRTAIAPPDADTGSLKDHGAAHFLQEWAYEPIIQNFLYELCITYLNESSKFNLPVFRLIQKVVNTLTDRTFAFHKIEPVVGEAKFRIEVFTEGNEANPLPIQKASQGTLSVLAMFGLIYNYLRAVWSEARGDDIFQQPAIVCIDEIDAHLHPSWQQKCVKLLRDTFPNTQFILTAHSPVIAAGCLENEVAVLRKTEGGFAVEQIREHLLGAESGDLYRRLFEIDDVDETYLYYLTQYTLADSHSNHINKLESKPTRTPAEEQELAHLHQEVRYIGEVAELKQKKDSADTTEQVAALEAEVRALKSRLQQSSSE